MGLLIQTTEEVTDTSLPKLYRDTIMSDGSLFLMDLSKTGGDSGEMLIDGGKIVNIAADIAAEITGEDEDNLSGINTYANLTPTTGLFEITPKKGLHGIISRTNEDSDDPYWKGSMPDALKTWLLPKYATKKIYASVWGRLTRTSDTGVSAFFLIGGSTSNHTVFTGATGSSNTDLGLREEGGVNDLGNFLRTMATDDVNGGVPLGIGDFEMFTKIGPYGSWRYFENDKSHSMIIYRVYIEDLDVSGRTYSEVDAIDKAMYDEAFAEGGKFHGDTYTDPDSLA